MYSQPALVFKSENSSIVGGGGAGGGGAAAAAAAGGTKGKPLKATEAAIFLW